MRKIYGFEGYGTGEAGKWLLLIYLKQLTDLSVTSVEGNRNVNRET